MAHDSESAARELRAEDEVLAARARHLAAAGAPGLKERRYQLRAIVARQGPLRFAVPSEHAQRVLDVVWVRLDHAPPHVIGWCMVGAEPVALIRLSLDGPVPAVERLRVVLVQTGRGSLAILADEVEGATEIDLLTVARAEGASALPFIFGHSRDLLSIVDVEALSRWSDIQATGR